MDTNSCVVMAKGGGEVEEGMGGINGDGRRLDVGWRTHNTVYR